MEVSALSREVMLRECCCAQPLSARLQSGIRFLHPPIPAVPWARLAARFPSRRSRHERVPREGELRAYHVPCECQSGLGLAYPPVAHRLRQVRLKHLNLATYHFGSSLHLLDDRRQHLRLVKSHDVYQRFTCVALFHSILAPDHLDASSRSRFSRLSCHPEG